MTGAHIDGCVSLAPRRTPILDSIEISHDGNAGVVKQLALTSWRPSTWPAVAIIPRAACAVVLYGSVHIFRSSQSSLSTCSTLLTRIYRPQPNVMFW